MEKKKDNFTFKEENIGEKTLQTCDQVLDEFDPLQPTHKKRHIFSSGVHLLLAIKEFFTIFYNECNCKKPQNQDQAELISENIEKNK